MIGIGVDGLDTNPDIARVLFQNFHINIDQQFFKFGGKTIPQQNCVSAGGIQCHATSEYITIAAEVFRQTCDYNISVLQYVVIDAGCQCVIDDQHESVLVCQLSQSFQIKRCQQRIRCGFAQDSGNVLMTQKLL